MAKFPKPVFLPADVYLKRAQRSQLILRSAKLGIKIRLAIIVFELFGVALINSSTLFLDAISGLMDVLSTIFLIICIKLARKPPDEDHPFGHGRYEPLGGLLIGLILIFIGAIMLFQQVNGFIQEAPQPFLHPWAWIFPATAMILLEICYQLIFRTAKKENSPALAADAVHYRIDGLTSLLATLTLIAAALVPEWSGIVDHIGAILIALFMIGLGVFAARENFNQLTDKVPNQEFFKTVEKAAHEVEGVQATEKIRIQLYGPDAHVDIDVEVEPKLTVDFAHQISQQVRAAIQKAWPAVRDVTVHIEPYYPGDH
ncbi:cation diffusion facilitator family transporter [Candidatus Protochlamydia sp. W-9]|uniref:cation diffusion facilitator family transporter n=1 Tax=Candidatus Protochlamydia sp. W-9 TaxID=1785087 RepID=UPI00096A6F83|nr:cation diffusion facilitator family transporter [Candidatus Protochlamydia sp. W-9]